MVEKSPLNNCFILTGVVNKVDMTEGESTHGTWSRMEMLLENRRSESTGTDWYQVQVFNPSDGCKLLMKEKAEVELLCQINGRKYNRKDGSGEAVFTSIGVREFRLIKAAPDQPEHDKEDPHPAKDGATKGNIPW